MSITRASLIVVVLLVLGLPAGASEPTEAAGNAPQAATPALPLDGPPPIEVETPPVGLRGLKAKLTVKAIGDLERSHVEIRNPTGDVVGTGIVVAGEATVIEITADRGGRYAVGAPLYAGEATFELRVIPAWLAVLPPVLAILVALAFRQVIAALVAGVWVGAWIVHGDPLSGALRTMDQYVIQALSDPNRLSILVFSLTLGGMVGVLSRSGGTIGLVQSMAPYATNSRRGQVVTWLMGLVIFFDDYANSLLVGNTMRPVTDRLKISREKLAYIVDSTAAPVASIALISTWIGYEVSLIGTSLDSIGSDLDPYTVFLRSLPYNFYPLLSLVLGFVIAVSVRDFGPMLAAERRAAAGKVLADTAVPLADFDSSELAPPEGKPRRWFNAVLPILVVLGVTFAGLWVTGRASMLASGYERGDASWLQFLGDLFGAADSYRALLWASAAGSVVAVALAVGQRILSLNEGMSAWVGGVKSMMMAVLILVLAWSISDICNALDTRQVIVAALQEKVQLPLGLPEVRLDPRFLPALVFLLAAATAFATGSSWATMGILIPLTVPVASALAQGAGFGEGLSLAILLGSVSSVLAGAIFGDHCSPISDTTVLSSTASGCDHVDHVRTQLPYALTVAGVGLLLGYVPAGFGYPPVFFWIPTPWWFWLPLPLGSLPLASLVLVLVVRRLGRKA